MGTGFIKIDVTTGDGAIPVENAHISIHRQNEQGIYETVTNSNGCTGVFSLPAPELHYTLEPGYKEPAYAVYDVDVSAEGFLTTHIHDVEIVDTETTILPVNLEPLTEDTSINKEKDIYIEPVGLLLNEGYKKIGAPDSRVLNQVIIPDYITVHLGIPTNSSARNVRVKFADYIKNVTSSEIYSTWPYNSIVANIHAIVTFAINRVYTEWYRGRGFNFDITNSTAYDQYYRDGGPIFENISQIVDGIFNVYARRQSFRNPFFTQFCNGTTSTCPGLSQWGTVTLANQGMSPIQILHYYYPQDLELVASTNITGITETYPGYALQIGSQGQAVQRMQNFLNRIRVNFPLIPLIASPDGIFGANTADAVRTFQRSFNLTADGIIGRSTWNKISFIYVGVTRMAELDSEGERVNIGQSPPNVVLSQGSRGIDVLELQFIINFISAYYSSIPTVIKDSIFGSELKNAVLEFQKAFNLTQDGVVGPGTWNRLYAVFKGIVNNSPIPAAPIVTPSKNVPYPGYPLQIGSSGENVRIIQSYLNTIRIVYPDIPYIVVDGSFGNATRNAVIAFQQQFLLTPDGVAGPTTWNKIVEQFMLVTGNVSVSTQYPGVPLRVGSQGSNVRLIQSFLAEIRSRYPSLPAVTVDGIFGPQTETAVKAFQRIFGLTADGIVGPETWYAIVNQRNAII